MSWLFSRALVEEFSAASCSDGEPSAPLSVMPTPHKFWRNDKTMEPSDLSQFGLTCAVLTESRGAALLMSFRADFHARTSAAQGRAPVLMALDRDSGAKWHGSFARFDPATSSWRTAQCSLLGGLELFSETWPRSGSMRNGMSFPRRTLAPTTFESASGLWPTVRKSDGERGGRGDLLQAVKGHPNKHFMMPTMTLMTAKHPGRVKLKPGQQTSLGQHVNATEAIPGQLNPPWVEWFMGWPESWTDLAALAMDKFREWQQQHSPLSPSNSTEEQAA